jgi:hypothetical protein
MPTRWNQFFRLTPYLSGFQSQLTTASADRSPLPICKGASSMYNPVPGKT